MTWAVGARARTCRLWARGGFGASQWCAWLVLAVLLTVSGRVQAQATAEDVIAKVREVSSNGPERMVFRQDVELRVLLFRWNFYADVVRDASGIDVQVHGAPKFLSPDVSASLLEVGEGLDGFDLELVEQGTKGGVPFYVLQGTARVSGQAGATGGTIWVNGRTWLIEEATLHYSWGAMTVEQTFQTINGYTLLKEQQATVDRLGAKLRVQYGGYSLD